MDPTGKRDEGTQVLQLLLGERSIADGAMSGHDRAGDEREQPRHGVRPLAAMRSIVAGPCSRRRAAARTWPQIGAGRKVALPNVWSPVPVGVDDDRDRAIRQLTQVAGDLAGMNRRGARVDDQHVISAEHDTDLLVEEREAPGEDAVADLLPGHGSMVSTAGVALRSAA